MAAVVAKGGCGPGKLTQSMKGLSAGARSRSVTAFCAVQSSSYKFCGKLAASQRVGSTPALPWHAACAAYAFTVVPLSS